MKARDVAGEGVVLADTQALRRGMKKNKQEFREGIEVIIEKV